MLETSQKGKFKLKVCNSYRELNLILRNHENDAQSPPLDLRHLETEAEHHERWASIRIMYFTVFLMSLGFSIVITGVWPYLNK
ncbi:unnamed protein product, partial [Nesidiocoris tenuis]